MLPIEDCYQSAVAYCWHCTKWDRGQLSILVVVAAAAVIVVAVAAAAVDSWLELEAARRGTGQPKMCTSIAPHRQKPQVTAARRFAAEFLLPTQRNC